MTRKPGNRRKHKHRGPLTRRKKERLRRKRKGLPEKKRLPRILIWRRIVKEYAKK